MGEDLPSDSNLSVHADDAALRLIEERRRRQTRRRRIYWSLAAVVLVVVMFYGARPTGRAIKAWQARRAARQAEDLMANGKWKEAGDKTRDALQLRLSEPQAWRAAAILLSRQGQGAAALEWWKKIDEAGQLKLEDRRDYAAAALAAGQVSTAATQVEALLAQKEGLTPADLLLAAKVNAARGDDLHSRDYAERAMADSQATPQQTFEAAFLILSTADRTSPEYGAAWLRMVRLARGGDDAVALHALLVLARQPPLPAGDPLSIAPPSSTSEESRIGADEIADRVEKNPEAKPADKLSALALRIRLEPARKQEYVTQAIERLGKGDDDEVNALTLWLLEQEEAGKVLELLPSERASTRRDFFLRRLEALNALGRWQEVKDVLTSERFPLEPVLQHMYVATASGKLGEKAAEENEWQRALEQADTAEELFQLASYAERNSAWTIADTAYAKSLSITPSLRAGYVGRLRALRATGQTAKAQAITAEMMKLWPDDDAVRNEDAYLRLLLGASGAEAEAAERLAQAIVSREPANWSARGTLGLARLRLGQNQAALDAFTGMRPTGQEPPGALAVRAAAFAATGWVDGARNDAHNLAAMTLLPEERALIAPLLAAAPSPSPTATP